MRAPLSHPIVERHLRVNAAYAKIVETLLHLKGEGYTERELLDALTRAAREAGIGPL